MFVRRGSELVALAGDGVELGQDLHFARAGRARRDLGAQFFFRRGAPKYISRTALLFLCVVLTAISSIFLGVFVFSYDGRPEHCEDGPALAGEGGGFAEVCVTGLTRATFAANFGSDYGEDPVEGERLSFGAVLAIFFPAVTDPLAGSNLSGDLADPQRSIPPGTIAAVLTTMMVFCGEVLLVEHAGGSGMKLRPSPISSGAARRGARARGHA